MSTLSESRLIDLVIQWVDANKRSANGNVSVAITPDTDLVATGLLDSFALVDLIVYIESLDGCTIDLTQADPAEFTRVSGLCRLALQHTS